MYSFLIRRLAFVFISLLGATAFVFALSRMAGDPVLLYAKPSGYGSEDYLDNLRKKLGTDRPLVVPVRPLGGTACARRPRANPARRTTRYRCYQRKDLEHLPACFRRMAVRHRFRSPLRRFIGRQTRHRMGLFRQRIRPVRPSPAGLLGRRHAGSAVLRHLGTAARRLQGRRLQPQALHTAHHNYRMGRGGRIPAYHPLRHARSA